MSKTKDTVTLRIPFAGFYCSIHDLVFDQTLEQINETSDRITIDNVDWQPVYLAYAQAYTKEAGKVLGLDINFTELTSPSYYNFETDCIFGTVSQTALADMYSRITTDPQATKDLRDHVANVLRPRSGFIPFYSDDFDTWGPLEDWDAPMMGVLLDFSFKQADMDEYGISETLSDMAHDLIWENVRDPSIVPGHVDGPFDDGMSP